MPIFCNTSAILKGCENRNFDFHSLKTSCFIKAVNLLISGFLNKFCTDQTFAYNIAEYYNQNHFAKIYYYEWEYTHR